jgi:hypothetical protein
MAFCQYCANAINHTLRSPGPGKINHWSNSNIQSFIKSSRSCVLCLTFLGASGILRSKPKSEMIFSSWFVLHENSASLPRVEWYADIEDSNELSTLCFHYEFLVQEEHPTLPSESFYLEYLYILILILELKVSSALPFHQISCKMISFLVRFGPQKLQPTRY